MTQIFADSTMPHVMQLVRGRYTPSNSSPIDAAMELTHYFYLGSDRIM
jgi:hypothetical protein